MTETFWALAAPLMDPLPPSGLRDALVDVAEFCVSRAY